MLEITFGTLLGLLTGLIPGLHPNNLIPILENLYSSNLYSLLIVSIVIITVNSFVSFIPTSLVGIPEDTIEISVPLLHKLSRRGLALKAIYYSTIAGLFAGIITIILTPLIINFYSELYNLSIKVLPIFLLFITLFLVYVSKNKFYTSLVMCLAGLLGYVTLNSSIRNSIFPLLSGLYGGSSLVLSLLSRNMKFYDQKLEFKIDMRRISFLSVVSVALALFLNLFPSISPTISAMFLYPILRDPLDLIAVLGGITTADALISVLSLYAVGNPRSGISVLISRKIQVLDAEILYLTIATYVLGVGVGALLTIKLSKAFLWLIKKLNYFWLNFAVLLFLIILILEFSGLAGILVFLTSTALGIYAQIKNVEKVCLGSSLFIPLMLSILLQL